MKQKITSGSGYRNIRILLVEDHPGDIRLLKEFLAEIVNFKPIIKYRSTLADAISALENNAYDVILLDLSLPDSQGIDTILKIKEKAKKIPIVIVTGLDDERTARKAIQMGVQDYLIKGQIDSNSLVRSINYAIARHKTNLTIKSLVESLQENELRLRKIIEDNADGIIIVNKKKQVCFMNPTAENLLGKSKDEFIGSYYDFPIVPDAKTEFETLKQNGDMIVIEVKTVEVEWGDDKAYLLTLRDISERKEYENKLLKSEKKYRDLFENSPYPILIIGMEGTIINCNSSLEHFIGIQREEILNRHFKEISIIQEETIQLFENCIESLKKGEIPKPLEITAETADKRKIWMALNFSLMKLRNKLSIYVLIESITKLKESKLQLKRVEKTVQKMDALIEHAPLPIFLIHQSGKILRVNEEAINLLGYEKYEFLKIKIFDLFESNSKKLIRNHYENDVYKIDLPNTLEATILSKDGKSIDVEINSAVLNISDDIIIQTFFSNITERKNSEKHRQLLLEQLLTLVVFKTKFLATMSHELRTPLNAILGFSQLLLEESYGKLNKEQLDFLDDICSAGDHLLVLINSILDLSKLEACKLNLQKNIFRIKEVLDEVLSIIQPLYSKKNLKYKVEGINEDDIIIADKLRFKQILYNILSNAINFTEKGSISLRGINRIDHWEFQIQDTGIGIEKKDYEIVFREFERIENDKIESVQGAGLGMALTKKLIQLHHGDIWFESEPGKGTTFYFTIPKHLDKKIR